MGSSGSTQAPDIATVARQVTQQQLLDQIERERNLDAQLLAEKRARREKDAEIQGRVSAMLRRGKGCGGGGDIVSGIVDAVGSLLGGPGDEPQQAAQDPAAMARAVSQQQLMDKMASERFTDEHLLERKRARGEANAHLASIVRKMMMARPGMKGLGGEAPDDVMATALPAIAAAVDAKLSGQRVNGAGVGRLAGRLAALSKKFGALKHFGRVKVSITLPQAVASIHRAKAIITDKKPAAATKKGGFIQMLLPLLPALIPAAVKIVRRLFGRGGSMVEGEEEARAALPLILRGLGGLLPASGRKTTTPEHELIRRLKLGDAHAAAREAEPHARRLRQPWTEKELDRIAAELGEDATVRTKREALTDAREARDTLRSSRWKAVATPHKMGYQGQLRVLREAFAPNGSAAKFAHELSQVVGQGGPLGRALLVKGVLTGKMREGDTLEAFAARMAREAPASAPPAMAPTLRPSGDIAPAAMVAPVGGPPSTPMAELAAAVTNIGAQKKLEAPAQPLTDPQMVAEAVVNPAHSDPLQSLMELVKDMKERPELYNEEGDGAGANRWTRFLKSRLLKSVYRKSKARRKPRGRKPRGRGAGDDDDDEDEEDEEDEDEGEGGRARPKRRRSAWQRFMKAHASSRGADEPFAHFSRRMSVAYRRR